MTINTQKLRKVAESANGFAGGDVAEWPLTTKEHIRSLARTAIQCADIIDAQTAEIARLRSRIAELRVAVQGLLNCPSGIYCDGYQDAEHKARIALQEKSNA